MANLFSRIHHKAADSGLVSKIETKAGPDLTDDIHMGNIEVDSKDTRLLAKLGMLLKHIKKTWQT